jgi:hypothetical protein
MIEIAIAFLFQTAAGNPAQAPPPGETSEEVIVTGKAEEPRIVCRMEYVTGSRVKKERICAAPNNKAQDTETKLQRDLSRQIDLVDPPEQISR